MAYVYKHTRLDNNEIFYIGIGGNDCDSYKRAKSKDDRSDWWYRITNKTDYKVEILYDDIEWGEACLKERELIRIIGRRCLNEGTLVNFTEGGEGFRGHHSEKTKTSISNTLSNKTYEEIHGVKNANKERLKRSEGAKNQWANCDEQTKLEINKKISLTKKGIPVFYKDVECPHCGKISGENVAYRWHFDNCKLSNPDKFNIKISEENKKYLIDNNIKPKDLKIFMKMVEKFINVNMNIYIKDIRKMNRDKLLELYKNYEYTRI